MGGMYLRDYELDHLDVLTIEIDWNKVQLVRIFVNVNEKFQFYNETTTNSNLGFHIELFAFS